VNLAMLWPACKSVRLSLSAALQDVQLRPLLEPLLVAARAQNQLQAQRLLTTCREGAQVQQQAEAAAARLSDMYYELAAELAEAKDQVCSGHARTWVTHGQLILICLLHRPYDGRGISSLPLLAVLNNAVVSSAVQCKQSSEPYLLHSVASCLDQHHSAVSYSNGSHNRALPVSLQEQQQEVQQLWDQLQQHMKSISGLSGFINSLSGCDVHPHAIDGGLLRQAAQLPEGQTSSGDPSPALVGLMKTAQACNACKCIKVHVPGYVV
jgi:hypothetical protein